MGTITKALNLLDYFSTSSAELGLMDFKKVTGRDKATLHRHLSELEENGFLEQNNESKKYRLGAAILRLSAIRESTFPARRIVSQHVNKLSQKVGELVHASLWQNNGMSSLCYFDPGRNGTRVYFSQAEILPLHATASGIATLAFGPPDLFEKTISGRLSRYTEATIIDKARLKELVLEARDNGYAKANQYYERDVSSVAVPFFENSPFAYGAIAIAVPTARMENFDEMQLVQSLWETSKAVSEELGGQIPSKLSQVWQLAA